MHTQFNAIVIQNTNANLLADVTTIYDDNYIIFPSDLPTQFKKGNNKDIYANLPFFGSGAGGGAVNSVTGNMVSGTSENPIVNIYKAVESRSGVSDIVPSDAGKLLISAIPVSMGVGFGSLANDGDWVDFINQYEITFSHQVGLDFDVQVGYEAIATNGNKGVRLIRVTESWYRLTGDLKPLPKYQYANVDYINWISYIGVNSGNYTVTLETGILGISSAPQVAVIPMSTVAMSEPMTTEPLFNFSNGNITFDLNEIQNGEEYIYVVMIRYA